MPALRRGRAWRLRLAALQARWHLIDDEFARLARGRRCREAWMSEQDRARLAAMQTSMQQADTLAQLAQASSGAFDAAIDIEQAIILREQLARASAVQALNARIERIEEALADILARLDARAPGSAA